MEYSQTTGNLSIERESRKLVLVNYAHNGYYVSQKKCTDTALKYGGFDRVISMNFADLSSGFRTRNSAILAAERGAGWWCWKPQVILQALQEIAPQDILVYSDCGSTFNSDVFHLLPYLENHEFVFSHAWPRIEGMTSGRRTILSDCKRFVLDYYGVGPESEIVKKPLISGGFIAMRKSEFVRSFMNRWLNDMVHDVLMIDDQFDTPRPEYPGFMRHMNDMGPLNLLLALEGKFHAITMEDRCKFTDRIWPREISYEYAAPPRRGVST